MNYPGFRPLAQLSAGPDGVVWRAVHNATQLPVELRVLSLAVSDPARWPDLRIRLAKAAMLRHSGAAQILKLDLEASPPWLAVEVPPQTTLAVRLLGHPSGTRETGPLSVAQASRLGTDLAATLAEAHRLGLVHGNLIADQVRQTAQGGWQLDFTGFQGIAQALSGDPLRRMPAAAIPADDICALGRILVTLLRGGNPEPALDSAAMVGTKGQTLPGLLDLSDSRHVALDQLLRAMLAPDPFERPSAQDVCSRLGHLDESGELIGLDHTLELANAPDVPGEVQFDFEFGRLNPGDTLGRFRLLEKIGQGGMGTVYRAEDSADGNIVAIKVLRAEYARRPDALRRFLREARMLAEVNSPYVANLLEVNEDQGVHYLVLEYVAGRGLHELLAREGSLSEPLGVALMADVARALAAAHARGILHRDVKPDNILLVHPHSGAEHGAAAGRRPVDPPQPFPGPPAATAPGPRARLTDFGLARQVVENESLLVTQAGAILGTPLYMAPEQATGQGELTPAVDVYSLGATLFHLLAGRPPFEGATPIAVITAHCQEPAPWLHVLKPAISEAASQLVARCLKKAPEERYASAGELLDDLLRILRGEPTSILAHPQLPAADGKMLDFEFRWDLTSSPEQLWPLVSNTERLNRAIGLPPANFTAEPQAAGGARRFAQFKAAGMQLSWEEHPFEWIEGRRMGVLREFSHGPFSWFISTLELERSAHGGTHLTHRLRVLPRGLLGRTLANIQMGSKARRNLERVYRRIDGSLAGNLKGAEAADPFETPASLPAGRRKLLEARLDQLAKKGVAPAVVERLGDFLAAGAEQDVARMRPVALARRWGMDERQVVTACFHAARLGLMELLWDILCPICRIPSEVQQTLRDLTTHTRCAACNLDFALDFANSVELVFRAHPDLRDCALGTYCIGGPAHSPHVAAQIRVAPGERFQLDLQLGEGHYRLRGPQLPYAVDFRVHPRGASEPWEFSLSQRPDDVARRGLAPRRQRIVLVNDGDQEIIVRVERTAARDDALTAAKASTWALFRELFPGEILSPGQLVSVAEITLLASVLDDAEGHYARLGEAAAFARIHCHFLRLGEVVAAWGGAVVKTQQDGLLAAFQDSVSAVQAALAMTAGLAANETTRGLCLRVGVHRGSAMVATLNEHLDYFGRTAREALCFPANVQSGQVGWTEDVAGEPDVARLVAERSLAVAPLAYADAAGEQRLGQTCPASG